MPSNKPYGHRHPKDPTLGYVFGALGLIVILGVAVVATTCVRPRTVAYVACSDAKRTWLEAKLPPHKPGVECVEIYR